MKNKGFNSNIKINFTNFNTTNNYRPPLFIEHKYTTTHADGNPCSEKCGGVKHVNVTPKPSQG
jgi:hypothetical protein